MNREEFTRRLLTRQLHRRAGEGKAKERIINDYMIENCVKSMERHKRYMNGKRVI